MTKKILTGAALVALAFSVTALPGIATADIDITNLQEAEVMNDVSVGASTGFNIANGGMGGHGGDGGRGGNTGRADSFSASMARSGNGGDGADGGSGGMGGNGGIITTGDATATSWLENKINENDTDVDNCGCEGEQHDEHVRVNNTSRAGLGNMISVGSETGVNDANGWDGGFGGWGGMGGDTGDANADTESEADSGNGGDAGMGGSGNDGGMGGDVWTGMSDSHSDVVNVLNRNITRVRR